MIFNFEFPLFLFEILKTAWTIRKYFEFERLTEEEFQKSVEL